jgi:hypothetical protein
MVACDVARAALVAVMAVPAVPLWLLAVLLVLVQLVEAPFSAAQGAVLPEMLGARYEAGQAVQQVTTQLCLVLGFAAAAFVVVGVGAHAALAIDAVTFAVSAVLIRAGLGLYPPVADGDGGPAVVSWWHRVAAGAVLVAGTAGCGRWCGSAGWPCSPSCPKGSLCRSPSRSARTEAGSA